MIQECITTQEPQEFIQKAISAISTYPTPLITQNSNAFDPGMGTGTFVIIGGKKGILTNSHVTKMFEEKGISYVWIPHTDTKLPLHFSLIVKLPTLQQLPDVDMAFIILDSKACDIVDQIGKQFWNLDQFIIENNGHIPLIEKNSMWLIYGSVAEGKKLIDDTSTKGKKILSFPNSGFYIVVPDLNSIQYGTCKYEPFEQLKVDNIICPIQTKERMPKDFFGMSGGALWQIIFDTDGNVQKVILTGIATAFGRPAKKAEWLECRGPVTLYDSFYPFCRKYIESECYAQNRPLLLQI